MTYPEKSLERLRDKIKDDRWTASVNSDGYPKVKIEGKSRLASHVLLESLGRPVPDGKVVMHRDNDPRNLDPKNLRIGTQQQNLKQMRDEGRDRPRGVPQEPDMKKHARIFWKYAVGGFGGLPPLTAQELENARKFQESMARPLNFVEPTPVPPPQPGETPGFVRPAPKHVELPLENVQHRYENLHPTTGSLVRRIAAETKMTPQAVTALLQASAGPGKSIDQIAHETGTQMGMGLGRYIDPHESDAMLKRTMAKYEPRGRTLQESRLLQEAVAAGVPHVPAPQPPASATPPPVPAPAAPLGPPRPGPPRPGPPRPAGVLGNPSSTPPAVPVPPRPHLPATPRINPRPLAAALPRLR